MSAARDRLVRNLRRNFRGPLRRFRVEYVGGSVFRYTCKTCGFASDEEMKTTGGGVYFGGNAKALEKFARYQNQNMGASGQCKRCTKKAKDARYPLDGAK